MTYVDPIGKVLIELRDAPAISAIVGTRVYGQERPADTPAPWLQVRDAGQIPYPRRSRVHRTTLAITCYGPRTATGDITALQIARSVVELLGQKGPRVAGNVLIFRTQWDSRSEVLKDPDTDEPYTIVLVSCDAYAPAYT